MRQACYSMYELLYAVSLSNAQHQVEMILGPMCDVQAAREAFEAAVAGQVAAPEKNAAVAGIDELLDTVLFDIDKLVSIL